MKASKLFSFLIVVLCFTQACIDKQAVETGEPVAVINSGKTTKPLDYNNTKGYWENGEIITEFNCPDSRFFPPIDIKLWDQTHAVNGRLPTYEETKNGVAICHYGEKDNPNVKPYNMILPKLALHHSPFTGKDQLVVVIQIVQTAKDTIVGYRYLTGGCGGSLFRDFYFLSAGEFKKATEWWALHGSLVYKDPC